MIGLVCTASFYKLTLKFIPLAFTCIFVSSFLPNVVSIALSAVKVRLKSPKISQSIHPLQLIPNLIQVPCYYIGYDQQMDLLGGLIVFYFFITH